ncbi:hypothetical protein JS528_07345 [Bifidobacterium sp. MA2]|uniref:Transposase n=1 Tax=Bifidobacterium santillanense TaxID=2809028 RepID=A0ABS5UQE9_9BIFI|nr:hypothetical protein [Bifidobacterium santillanense]MBT1173167.1 hypothetical protein [Bifidobacterium santillanense]
MERRVIMCRTRPVLEFDYDRRSSYAVGVGTIIDHARLPLELITHGKDAVYARRIDAWWSHRAIPTTRDGIRRALDVMGIPNRAVNCAWSARGTGMIWTRLPTGLTRSRTDCPSPTRMAPIRIDAIRDVLAQRVEDVIKAAGRP